MSEDTLSKFVLEENEHKLIELSSKYSSYVLSQPLIQSDVLLSIACKLRMNKLIVFLIKKGVNIHGIYNEGKSKHSPISQLKYFHDNKNMFKTIVNFFLLNRGDIDHIGSNFKTLLYELIINCTNENFTSHYSLIKYVLEKGANPNCNYHYLPGVAIIDNFYLNKNQKKKLLLLLICYGMDVTMYSLNNECIMELLKEREIGFLYYEYIYNTEIHEKIYYYIHYLPSDSINTTFLSGNICNDVQTVKIKSKQGYWAFHLSEIKHLLLKRKNPYTMEYFSKNTLKKLLKKMDNIQESSIDEFLSPFHNLLLNTPISNNVKQYHIQRQILYLEESINFYFQSYYPYLSVSSIKNYNSKQSGYLLYLLQYRYFREINSVNLYMIILDLYTIKGIFSKNNFEISFLIKTCIEHMDIVSQITNILQPIKDHLKAHYKKLPFFDLFRDYCQLYDFSDIYDEVYNICERDEYFLSARICWNELIIDFFTL